MILIFLITFLPAAELQNQNQNQNQNQDQDPCLGSSCNPQLGDLMVGRAARLTASSTCGLEGAQRYCIIGYLQGEQKCFTCDSQLPYDPLRNPNSHRVENIITTFEPERKWWQSENGVQQVSIQLDLETVFQFSHLVLTFKSFRPAAMLVERSKDFGRTWKVFRYFAEDCALHFPSVSHELADSVDDVVCDGRYSGSEPSTGGEVVLKALDPVFEIENPYAPNIQDLISLTNIRVNFTRLFTLGDTLLARRRRNPQDKYYYSLYNMVVRGSCFCNGHASQCEPEDGGRGDVYTQPGMVHGRCVCQHNTAGDNCERCRDFHHDSPWGPGGENAANICRRCDCHGHSDSCHFDAARYDASGGVSGGVCDSCLHDRTGPQCERCRPFWYQDPQRALEDPHACRPCDCDPAGSHGGGLCDALSGQCLCKENVEGQRCDRCKCGFFGLRQDDPAGCQECRCHGLGSVGSCDPLTGRCECEPFTAGQMCDRCVAGFWGLGKSRTRCSPCDCDIGGAHSNMCCPEDGQCPCLPNMIGRRCSEPAPGYFLPSLNYFLYEAELAAPLAGRCSAPTRPPSPSASPLVDPVALPPCEHYFRQQGFDFKVSNGQVVLVRRTRGLPRQRRQGQNIVPLDPGRALQIVPGRKSPDQLVTWTGEGFIPVLEGAGLRFTVDNLPLSIEYQLVIHYEHETGSDWLATVSVTTLLSGDGGCSNDPTGTETLILPGNSRASILDPQICLNARGRYFVDVVFRKQSDGSDASQILVDSMGLIPRTESVQDFCSQSDRDFKCTGLAVGPVSEESSPAVCEALIMSLSARLHNGAVPCRCDVIGSLGPGCSKLGGACECKPNVIGRCCDTCAPLTFGFGPEGCERCGCDPRGSVFELCGVGGQCTCRSEVTGRRCDRCQPGFWGFPLCRPCECNGLSETCDGETGECQSCREHTTGPKCDRCAEGFHGNPLSRRPCRPCHCPDSLGSGRFFATSCRHDSESLTCNCQEGHIGSRCDVCSPGFYGDLTLPEVRCEPCPCNNNTDPTDPNACNGTTGECLRCLHNTAGRRCQDCRPGYHGNALQQSCTECLCDRRGTAVTQCPLESPCLCDPRTGRCPCRTGVTGEFCDECEDGFWNLDGPSGCQPCSCNPANAVSNTCDKVSGQCPCRPEFGGRQCDECGGNHFGNPDLQCVSCDCNLEGTERPSCDPETGECVCRAGVTGIFCDECAPGFDSAFPACETCHPCAALWTKNITDVQRAAQRMRAVVPGNNVPPIDGRGLRRMLEMLAELRRLADLRAVSPREMERLEKLKMELRKLKDAIDPNPILIDSSPLLNTEMDDILLEFRKLQNNLKAKHVKDSNNNKDEQVEELLRDIQKLHEAFMSDEKRTRNSNKAVENSMDTRQEVKHKLSSPPKDVDLARLEKKLRELSVVSLNQKVCGGAGLQDCSGCGGALCGKCGGPDCDGAVPLSQTASETTGATKGRLIQLPPRLQEAGNKISAAKMLAQDTKDQARDLQDRIGTIIGPFESEKNETKELIRRVKQFLIDDFIPQEDIEKMVKAVLSIQLPRSPDGIRSMINDIKNLFSNATEFQDNLKDLEKDAEAAKELLQKALELREQTKEINVKEIIRVIFEADETQSKANDDVETASRNIDEAKDQIQDIEAKLDGIEAKLMNHSEELLKEAETVKNKTETNRKAAREAREAAESALRMGTDPQAQLDDVMQMFQALKQKLLNQSGQDESSDRLKSILKEAKDMTTQVEDKLIQIQDVELRMKQLQEMKKQREAEVSELLEKADSLQQDISTLAERYSTCSS